MVPERTSFADRWNSIQEQPDAPANPQSQMTTANPNVPMGNPLDTIAQMLGLDLSAMSSPSQQGQAVTSAVESLVLKLHAYYDAYGDVEGGEPQDGAPEGDEDQEFEDDSDEGGNPPPGQGQDVEQDDDEPPEDDEDPQQGPPAKAKKGIAASFGISPRILQTAVRARKSEIFLLSQQGYVSPVTAKELISDYASEDAILLSLSQDDESADEFERVTALIRKNGPILRFGEGSSNQSNLSVLSTDGSTLALSAEELTTAKNPMIADAERRSAQVKK